MLFFVVMDRPGLSGRLAASSSLGLSPAVCEAPGSLAAVTLTGSGLLMGPLSAQAGRVARRWGGCGSWAQLWPGGGHQL